MYAEYFGLESLPFQITPDTRFYFSSRAHQRALATMTYGLYKNEGFVVVTGEVGAGKTTLIEVLLSSGRLNQATTAKINTTQLEPASLLAYIELAFGFETTGRSKAESLRNLGTFFARAAKSDGSALLIVDEAQNLSAEALEELRMLSNFQAEARGVFQMLLVGQPEFNDRLKSRECEQIRQRVVASYHLRPLARADVRQYVEHRLRSAGWDGSEIFTPDALERVYQTTQGVPRKINRMCDRLLLYAYLEGYHRVNADIVNTVEAELREEHLGDEAFEAEQGSERAVAAEFTPQVVELPARLAGDQDKVVVERDRLYDLFDQVRTLQSELTIYRNKLNRIYDLLGRRS